LSVAKKNVIGFQDTVEIASEQELPPKHAAEAPRISRIKVRRHAGMHTNEMAR
jgi:hypothetical protein